MSDEEFEVIDELYFVTSYQDLKSTTDYSDNSLKSILVGLIEKGWIKVYKSVDVEIDLGQVEQHDLVTCFFLASKKGLFEHNSQ